jgi:hypothetical protein
LPKKYTSAERRTQAKRREALRAQKRLIRAQDKQHREYLAHVKRVQRIDQARIDKRLRDTLRNVKGTGIYEPKSLELTPYRRKRAKAVYKEYGKYLDKKEYFFVRAPKHRRQEVRERAEGLHLKPTPTGLFVEREGHKKAYIKENPKNKELYVKRTGRTKRGPLKGRQYSSTLPLASVDELDKARDRIRELAKSLPLRNSKESLSWKIRENGIEGYSHSTFDSVEGILRYLDKYDKSTAARINFYRHIELERVETSAEWNQKHPPMGKAARRARLKQSKEAIALEIKRGQRRQGR